MKYKLIASALIAFVLTPVVVMAAESHCISEVGEQRANTPSNHFTDNGDGTVTHRRTGLTWSRCALGQTWNGGNCEDRALVYHWTDAVEVPGQLNGNGGFAGHDDWRLPSREELLSIVEHCREDPAINPSIFPGTPSTGFWTSTTTDEEVEEAWFVGFFQGLDYPYLKTSSYRVRLVRGE